MLKFQIHAYLKSGAVKDGIIRCASILIVHNLRGNFRSRLRNVFPRYLGYKQGKGYHIQIETGPAGVILQDLPFF